MWLPFSVVVYDMVGVILPMLLRDALAIGDFRSQLGFAFDEHPLELVFESGAVRYLSELVFGVELPVAGPA